jgi:hypothetical protein
MRVMTLLLGEAKYDPDDTRYIKNSIRSFVTYSASNDYHALDDLDASRSNPILGKIPYCKHHHLGSRFNLKISEKRRL